MYVGTNIFYIVIQSWSRWGHDIYSFYLPYYMKFWRHFNLAKLAIFRKIVKLKCTKIKALFIWSRVPETSLPTEATLSRVYMRKSFPC